MKATEETKAKAKELGVKSYWLKSEETLIDEIELADMAEETETVNAGESYEQEELVEVDREDVVSDKGDIQEEELTLPTDTTPKLMLWSIKAVGKKSKYWKYKHLLG